VRSLRNTSLTKAVALGLAGVFFLAVETYFFHKIFYFLFQRTDPSLHFIARALSLHLLQLIFLVFGVMLVYSNLVTSISVFLTSNDMKILLVWPVRPMALYLHKFMETLIRSSAVLALFVMPALITYGMAREAGWGYYVLMPILVGFFLMMPCSLAVPVMLMLARIFPTKRLQQVLIAAGLVATTLSLFAFRMLRIEDALKSAGTAEQLVRWSSTFRLPDWPWSPSSWLVHAVDAMLDPKANGEAVGWVVKLAVWSTILLAGSCLVGAPILRTTWSRSFGVARRNLQGRLWLRFGEFRIPGLSRGDSAMVLKEIKSFARDLARWSQIVMMIPLIGFYLLNMHLMPFRDQFREIYYLLNLFMIAFIQAAIGARYLFPSISWEGPSLWLVRVSPYSVWRLVVVKFVFLSLPLLVLTCALTILSFWILEFPWELLTPSLVMALATTVLFSALAVGFGAVLPRFRYEHHLEISLGPGGILYMLTTLAFSFLYISLLARPAIEAMGSRIWDVASWDFSNLAPPSSSAFHGWLATCAVGAVAALVYGIYSLAQREEFDR
jgi:ABC-2 type transport system permease protein